MSRGDLPPDAWDRIKGLLPDLESKFDQVHSWNPDMIAVAFHHESDIPVAVVCLIDAVHTLSAARYGLLECYAHGIYYRDVAQPRDEMKAVWFERYYVDDAAFPSLRLPGLSERCVDRGMLSQPRSASGDAQPQAFRTDRRTPAGAREAIAGRMTVAVVRK